MTNNSHVGINRNSPLIASLMVYVTQKCLLYSQGACSLLNYNKQATGSDASIGAMSIPSVELCDSDSYKITSYGITSSNEWQASSICPNSKGGSDYTLV